MKKYDKSYYVGIAVLIAAILASVLLGWAKKPISADVSMADGLDTSLSISGYTKYLRDDAGVLDENQEKAICTYNANWDHRYNSVAAVVTIDTANGASMKNLTYEWADDMGLGEGDAILLVAVDDGLFYLNYGDDFATIITSAVYSGLGAELERQGLAGENIVNFYTALDGVYRANFGLGNAERRVDTRSDGILAVASAIFILIALFILLSVLENARFNAYHSRYYGVAAPPFIYHPIFFWHRPGSWWYRRRWVAPPPPPPPPSHSTGSSASSVFGGAGAKPSRGGGTFGGHSTGTGMRGGFGGSFGGSRGGGFRSSGGGFHGGSRGGGFGGRR